MNKQSKYRFLMDDIQDKICRAEIGVTGLYKIMLETLDEAEQELAIARQEATAYRISLENLEASLPKIKADAVRSAVKTTESRVYSEDHFGLVSYHNEILSQDVLEYANKLEAGELDDCECAELGSICDHCEDDI